MRSRLIRAGLVLAGALVVAWAVVSYRGVDVLDEAERLASRAAFGDVPAAQIEAAQADLRDARRFSADREFLVAEGSLLYAAGRTGEGYAVSRQVTSEEPDNLRGWLLAFATAPDRRARTAVRREITRLNPWAADALPR